MLIIFTILTKNDAQKFRALTLSYSSLSFFYSHWNCSIDNMHIERVWKRGIQIPPREVLMLLHGHIEGKEHLYKLLLVKNPPTHTHTNTSICSFNLNAFTAGFFPLKLVSWNFCQIRISASAFLTVVILISNRILFISFNYHWGTLLCLHNHFAWNCWSNLSKKENKLIEIVWISNRCVIQVPLICSNSSSGP